MEEKSVILCVVTLMVILTCCYAPPVKEKKAEEAKQDEQLPEYARYLRQVVQILEKDEDYVQKLMNASDDDLRSGKVADGIDFVRHDVRTKLDELKRQEIERQRQIRRQMNDHQNGLKEREHWNPVFDDDNPDFFTPEDFKKLLDKVREYCITKLHVRKTFLCRCSFAVGYPMFVTLLSTTRTLNRNLVLVVNVAI